MSTKVDNFANAFIGEINKYTKDVTGALSEEITSIANEGKDELRNTKMPPATASGTAIPSTRRQWKEYSKSWSVKEDKKSNYENAIIHNRKHYRLTHLLENGHLTKNGQRTRAFKHIAPVEEKLVKKLEDNTIKIIENGGKI